MDSSSESYFATAKSTISSLFGFVLWASSRLPLFPMQSPKGFPTHQYLQLELGLKTLIFPEAASQTPPRNLDHHHHPHIVHSFMVSSSLSLPPRCQPSSMFLDSTTSWSSSAMDDLIGTDSGVQVMLSPEQNKLWVERTAGSSTFTTHIKRSRTGTGQISDRRKKEYPPPIPLLAQTGNWTRRMPWNLTRHCYNGRLVLKGEKVKQHEYFEALRENGRLVINLVPLEGYHFDDDLKSKENEEELEMEEDLQFNEEVDAGQIKAERLDDDGDENNDDEDDDESGNNVEKAMAMMAYNSVPQSHLGMTSRCKRYQNLSNHFKSEGAMVDLVESSSFVSFGSESDPNIPQDTNTYFAHSDSSPLRPLMVSVM